MVISVIGYDPGAHGAIAFTSNGKDVRVIRFHGRSVYEMRHDVMDMQGALPLTPCPAYGEKVGFRPSDIQTDKIHGIVKMVGNAGQIQGALEVLGYEIKWATNWHLEFGLGGIATYEERKKAAHKIAKDLFGSWVTKDIADGMLICVYGWRKENGVLTHGKKEGFITRPGTGVIYTRRSSR